MAFEEVFFAALLRTGADPNTYSDSEPPSKPGGVEPISTATITPTSTVMVADVDSRVAADVADLTRKTISISVSTPEQIKDPGTPEFLAINTPVRDQFNPDPDGQQKDTEDTNTDNPDFLPLLQSNDPQASDETLTVSSATGAAGPEPELPAPSISNSDRATDNFETPLGPSASVSVSGTDHFETTDASSVNTSPDIPLRFITQAEFAKHNKPHDMWLSIRGEVYNVTQFQHVHPGGAKRMHTFSVSISIALSYLYLNSLADYILAIVLVGVAGKDATKKFDKYHRRALLDTYKASFRIGKLEEGTGPEAAPKAKRGLLGKLGFGKKGT